MNLMEELDAVSIIPTRYENVPLWRTYGRYRKKMKRRFYTRLYHQRNKTKTILSVVNRMFVERLASRLVMMQNKELMLRLLPYNMHRLIVFMVWFLQSHFELTGI